MAKILLITHIYPPAIDGGSRVIVKLGEYLSSQNHQIKYLYSNCFSTDDFSYNSSHHTPAGLPVITFFHKPLKFLSKYFPSLRPFAKGPIFSPLSLVSFIKYQPDLIIAGPLPTTIVIYARIIRFFTKSKLLINASFHETDPDFQSPILIKTLQSADYLWTLSDYESDYFVHHLTISSSKIINIGNGVDQSYLSPSTTGQHLIFVGSLSAHKGIATLIKAYLLLKTDQKLYICGQKTLYFPKIKSLINHHKNIILKTNLSDIQIKKLIKKSSILILPSSQESFGLVLLEAWACHKPVITSDIPQLSEIIAKSNGGLTFKLNDYHDLALKITAILKNPGLQQSLSNSGYKFATAHTWDRIGKNLCQKISL